MFFFSGDKNGREMFNMFNQLTEIYDYIHVAQTWSSSSLHDYTKRKMSSFAFSMSENNVFWSPYKNFTRLKIFSTVCIKVNSNKYTLCILCTIFQCRQAVFHIMTTVKKSYSEIRWIKHFNLKKYESLA